MCLCVCVCACMQVCGYEGMQVCMCACVQVCMYACMHAYLPKRYMHAHCIPKRWELIFYVNTMCTYMVAPLRHAGHWNVISRVMSWCTGWLRYDMIRCDAIWFRFTFALRVLSAWWESFWLTSYSLYDCSWLTARPTQKRNLLPFPGNAIRQN